MTDRPYGTVAELIDPQQAGDPDRTRELAQVIADAVRALNYATAPWSDYPGLTYPADVHALTGNLAAAASGLDQCLRQTAAWLDAEAAAGRIEVNAGDHIEDPDAATAATVAALDDARRAAGQLAAALTRAQNATTWMAAADPEQEVTR